tara:strand:- start:264 stop:371 length:108 start_codon:yes stop_codon:yes gene_type:complete
LVYGIKSGGGDVGDDGVIYPEYTVSRYGVISPPPM